MTAGHRRAASFVRTLCAVSVLPATICFALDAKLQKYDAITGHGLGFVDVLTAHRVLTKRFASGSTLIVPWAWRGNPEFREIQRQRSDRQPPRPAQ